MQSFTEKTHLGWSNGPHHELTRQNLLDVMEGRTAALVVESFLTPDVAAALADPHLDSLTGSYKNVVPRIRKSGPSVFEYDFSDRAAYFARAQAETVFDTEHLLNVDSPVEAFKSAILDGAGWLTVPASDGRFGSYFAGTARSIDLGTPVHIDFAPFESPGWEMISGVEEQLAANIYLDDQPGQGDLVIYERRWTPELERHRFSDRFGYDDEVVDGARCLALTPRVGTLTLFNSRYFHRVEPSSTSRLTCSFFLAHHRGQMLIWS